jgi:hypothetical protein
MNLVEQIRALPLRPGSPRPACETARVCHAAKSGRSIESKRSSAERKTHPYIVRARMVASSVSSLAGTDSSTTPGSPGSPSRELPVVVHHRPDAARGSEARSSGSLSRSIVGVGFRRCGTPTLTSGSLVPLKPPVGHFLPHSERGPHSGGGVCAEAIRRRANGFKMRLRISKP